MKIEPNENIGMRSVTILLYRGELAFTSGEKMKAREIHNSDNPFISLCKQLDANLEFIHVLQPDPSDEEYYFALRDLGSSHGVHVQSLHLRPEEVWNIWNVNKQ